MSVDSMRTIRHHEFGEPAAVLSLETGALPEPGPAQARVRMVLSPIHNHDVLTIRGQYGFKPSFPASAGTEAVGIVDAVGSDVENVRPGQRVASGSTFGVWSDYFLADASTLTPVPDAMTDESAAQVVSMPFSALSLLESLDLRPGDWFIQNAANGAVGRMIAQLATARGLHVVGLVRREAAVAELAAQGIERIVATDSAGWRDQVSALSGGEPLRVGVDSVGGPAGGDLLSMLGTGGELIVFGAMGSQTLEVNAGDLIFNQTSIRGFWANAVRRQMEAATRARLLEELFSDVLAGTLTLPVDSTYDLADVQAGMVAQERPGRSGKVLLRGALSERS